MSITLKISADNKYTITFDSIWMKCIHKTLVCLHSADKNKVLGFVRGRKKYYSNQTCIQYHIHENRIGSQQKLVLKLFISFLQTINISIAAWNA